MNTYHATPYDITASGFYFESLDDYQAKAATHVNDHGQPVEEFEIQFIDGDPDDCALFGALRVTQATLARWFEAFEGAYTGEDLVKVLYLVHDHSMDMAEIAEVDLDDVMLFAGTAMQYAEQYLDDTGILDAVEAVGLNPAYVDIEALARDMMLEGTLAVYESGGETYVVEYLG